MTQEKTTFQLTNGHLSNPSTKDLIEAFATAYDSIPKMVTFIANNGMTVWKARITGLEYESGSPGMFLVKGFISLIDEQRRFEGFYSASRKGGVITV